MKFLLTGGSGFIGKHLVAELTNFGHKVYLLKSNISDMQALQLEIENTNFDIVIHLAGLSHVANHSPSLLYETNVIGSQNVISAIEKIFNKKKIFLASTCHIYANTKNHIAETSPVSPKSHYAASKLAMEFMCGNTARKNEIVSLRLFNCIGTGQKESFLIPKVIRAHLKKEPIIHLGNLEIKREFNDVRWATGIIRSLAEINVPPGDYNICSGEAYKVSEILKIISKKTKHFPKILTDINLLRPDEQHIIVGDPTKTTRILNRNGVYLNNFTIHETLDYMINHYQTLSNV